ncbi:MAG: HEAT repeat domain-containing protein, partial [Planctomycetota bacterium]
ALTLGRIPDPRCLDPLRKAAGGDKGAWVRVGSLLALGALRQSADLALFQEAFQDAELAPIQRAAVPFAILKIRSGLGASSLHAETQRPAGNANLRGAAVLAAYVATPEAEPECLAALEDPSPLVRAAAAAGLVVRPPASAQVILDRLRREKDRNVRGLLVSALAAMDRTPAIRAALLSLATDQDEKKEPRIAALLGLADEWGVAENVKPLKRLLLSQNDPIVGAAIHAIARTGQAEAVEELLKLVRAGSPYLQSYALGSLLRAVADAPQPLPKEAEVFDACRRRAADDLLSRLQDLGGKLVELPSAADRKAAADGVFAALADPARLGLWRLSREARGWEIANSMLPVLLDLDDLADRGGKEEAAPPDGSAPGGPAPGGGEAGQRAPSSTPEEVDLLDFLAEQPYLRKEDLGAR